MTTCVVCKRYLPDERIWIRCACNHPVCEMCFLRKPKETDRILNALHSAPTAKVKDKLCYMCGHPVGYASERLYHKRAHEFSIACWKCNCRHAVLSDEDEKLVVP